MAEVQTVDVRQKAPPVNIGKGIGVVILIIVIIVGVLIGTALFSSAKGQDIWYDLKTSTSGVGEMLNPNNLISQIKSTGNVWDTKKEDEVEKIGIDFTSFEQITGSRIVRSGNIITMRFEIEVQEDVKDYTISYLCIPDKKKLDYFDVENGECVKGSKKTCSPKQISYDNELGYSNLFCKIPTKEDAVIDDEDVKIKGEVTLIGFEQSNKREIYFTKESLSKDFFTKTVSRSVPLTNYKDEPLKVSIGTSDRTESSAGMPVIVEYDLSDDNIKPPYYIGVGIANSWDGKLGELNSIEIDLPNGIKIKNDEPNIACPFNPDGVGDVELINSDYKIGDKDALGNVIGNYRFVCELDGVEGVDLGTKEYVSDDYVVRMDYDYILEEEVTLTLVSSKGTTKDD